MVLRRLPYAFVLASLLVSCSKKDSDRNEEASPPLAAQPCRGLAEGQTAPLTFYKKDKATWGETCAGLTLQMNATCSDGRLLLQGEGFPACEETQLQKLTIKGVSTLVKVDGAPLLLTLEGLDQSGEAFVIDSSKAIWTSSSDQVLVSADGHVTATETASNVVITAVVDEHRAEFTVTAVTSTPNTAEQNCEDTLHGATKEFTRYKQALVNFQSSCEPYQAVARCDNGQFIFKPEDAITECRVAAVKEFRVDPPVVTLRAGESRAVTAEAVDESFFKGSLNAQDIKWTAETAPVDQGKLTLANGVISLSADLLEDAQVKAEYRQFTGIITVAKTKLEATSIAFEKSSYLAKSTDTLDLRVLAFAGDKPVEIDSTQLVLTSSDPQKVAIENNQARVLNPGGNVIITAQYAGSMLSAQTQLTIEDELTISKIAGKDDALVYEKPWVVATAQLKVDGPAQEDKPTLVSSSELCAFAIYLSRDLWMLDVELKADGSQVIPPSCEVEVTVTSAAGQQAAQKLTVPVRYAALDFREFPLQDPSRADNVIASLGYRLSSNVIISKVSVAPHRIPALTPASCLLSAVAKDGVIEVHADITAEPELSFCAGFLTFDLAIDGQPQTLREQVSVSSYRPFRSTCEDRSNRAIQQTIKAMTDALSLRNDCQLLDNLLRRKNTESLFRNAKFALSLASQNLSDLEPLARLTGLRELILTDNPALTDLRPLTHLKSLQRIDLEFTGVTDFSPLYQLDAMQLFFSDATAIDCKKSEVTNKPIKELCTQE